MKQNTKFLILPSVEIGKDCGVGGPFVARRIRLTVDKSFHLGILGCGAKP